MSVLRNKEILRVKTKRRMSQIEASGNLALALNAMKQDGVKLVNIGKRTSTCMYKYVEDTLLTSRLHIQTQLCHHVCVLRKNRLIRVFHANLQYVSGLALPPKSIKHGHVTNMCARDRPQVRATSPAAT